MASRACAIAYSVIVLLCSRCVSHCYSVFYFQSFISFFEQLSQFFDRGKHLQACALQKKVGILLRSDTYPTVKAVAVFSYSLSANRFFQMPLILFLLSCWELNRSYSTRPSVDVLEWSRNVSPNRSVAHWRALEGDEGRSTVADFD